MNVDDHDDALWELYEFVVRRLDERIRLADEAGDKAAHDFALGSRRIMIRIGQDLTERPWGHPEMSRFLLRTASRYRRHPEFQQRWGLGLSQRV